jgi:MFS family permease
MYPWLMVVLGAVAMVGTLPGRTHGLGMVTERLLADGRFWGEDLTPAKKAAAATPDKAQKPTPEEVQAEEIRQQKIAARRVVFGEINLWATLVGALFCIGCGRLIDRVGSRIVLPAVFASLGIVVLAMPHLTGLPALVVAITLTRGFGQSALSVASLTLVGKWFSSRIGQAMAVYSVLVGLGFMAAFAGARPLRELDWTVLWSAMGYILLALAVVYLAVVRNDRRSIGLASDQSETTGKTPATQGHTLVQALGSPAFWVFALASSLYGLVAAATSLFNESILNDRGFNSDAFYILALMTTFVGLAANFTAGWLANWLPLGRLMAVAMGLLAAALCGLQYVSEWWQLVVYGVAMGTAGGMVTVLFFVIWGKAFGQRELGRIQGAAQMLTVFASALGPALVAYCKAQTGAYLPMLQAFAGCAVVLGVVACVTGVPTPHPVAEPEPESTLDSPASMEPVA